MTIKHTQKIGFRTCWLPLLLGIFITLALAWSANYKNNHELNSYLNNLANKTENLIEQRFAHFEYGLRGARGAIISAGIDEITRKQFENYSDSRNIEAEFPGALGFGFIRRVSLEQESDFLARAQQDGVPNFSIRALTPHDNDRFVIQYIFPAGQNQQALGLDIGSEANRRSAALSAARDDKPYLTAPITLVQANKKPRKGALVLLPIYRNSTNLNTAEAREAEVIGWSYAPLVIDDVLANIDILTDQSTVTLTNLKEDEPFYRSSHSSGTDFDTSGSSDYSITRSIFVLGQHWEMEIKPSSYTANEIKSLNVNFIVIFGLVLTLLTLFIINVLRRNQTLVDQGEETYQLNLQSVVYFLKSTQFRQSSPFGLLLFFLVFVVSSGLIIQNHFSEMSDNLSKTTLSATSILDEEATQYRRDTLFLANTPPIEVLTTLELSNNVSELKDVSALIELSDERLTDIFKAYMLSNTDVYQVRFIEADNGWQERVKIERHGEELQAFSKESLQSKENESYIDDTLEVGVDHVFQSEINLNREFGKIEQPSRPVWRFSTPIFTTEGRPLGIIIINVNANNVLQNISRSIAPDTTLYVTNQEGDFLLHPNPSKVFTFEFGSPYQWQDAFHSKTSPLSLSAFDFVSFKHQQGNVYVNEGRFSLDENSNDRVVKIYSSTSQFLAFQTIAIKIGSVLVVLILISLLSIAVQYWVWLREKIRQKDIWNTQIEFQRNKEMTRFKGLLESAPDATFVIDESDIIQIVNAQAESVFGYDRADLEGQKIQKLLPEYSKEINKSTIINQMQTNQAVVIESNKELLALKNNGNEFPVEISLSAVSLDEKILLSASVRDITTRLEFEAKLRTALHDAELATEAKSAFLANTSHEIRTPLNAIIGLGYLLAEEKLTEEQHQLVSKIQISGKSLLGIVNDVLDLSKIEANEMELEAEPVELRELCEEVSSVFALQAKAKKLDFHLELDPQLPHWVMTDSTRLRQILSNLLSNSLKFTMNGEISMTVKVNDNESALSEKHVNVHITITDTGIGISPEAQSRLFKPFTQADSSTTRHFGGTGLGLSIVHQLAHLMGGKIGVESTKNVGSTFWVDLPFKVESLEEIAGQDNQNQTLFVMIAEDDPIDAMQLQKMTRALGWRSEIVNNGIELVDAYLSRHKNKLRPPDAIIVDWQMPLMDGLGAISTLANKIGRENIPAVLMVSSHDKESIASHDPEHYVNSFLLKPVDPSSLFNAVNNIVTLNTGNAKRVLQSTRAEAVGAKWLTDMKVLVVDDSLTNLIVVSHVLKHNGAIVQTANSGEEALTLLEDSSNDYDAVLMDVQMPGIDGLETTQRVRNDLGLTSLPIIALTAGALVEEKKRAIEAGMNDFLTKPINPSKLINVLRTLIEAYRGKEIIIKSLNAPEIEVDTWPAITGLNLDKAKNILLGDKNLFLETLSSLLIEYATLTLVQDDDADLSNASPLRLEIASQIHKLRSISGMIGAENIQDLASQAEKALRAQGDPAKHLLVDISLALQELQQASAAALEAWKKEKMVTVSSAKGTAPKLQLETVQHILTLLEEQDLSAIEEFEEHSASFLDTLGNDQFETLQENITKLQYKEAISILSPLCKNLGTA